MSNYIVEAFKAMNLLESEDISLNADGVDTLSGFMAEAGVDPDEEEVDVFDIEAGEEDELKQSYVGKVVLECSVCHSNIFVDKSEVSVGTDEEGLACYDIECPYCMSNDGYEIIGEVAPFNAEESEELMNPEDEEEIPAVDVEGAVDDVDEEDLEESLKKQQVKESWEHEFEAEYDSIQNDPSLSDEEKKEYIKKLFADFSMNEELKLDGVEELYKDQQLRGVDGLKGEPELEGSDEIRGPIHKTHMNENVEDFLKDEDKLRAFIKKNRNCIDYDFSDSYFDETVDDMNLQELQNLAYEVESELTPINESMDSDELLELFLKYHEDNDNYIDNPEAFDRMYKILDKYGDEDEDVNKIFVRAPYEDQVKMVNLITPSNSDIREALDPTDRMTDEEKLKRGWVVNGKKRVLVNTPDGKVVAKIVDTDEPDSKASDFVRESIKSKRNKKSLKEDIEDVTVSTEDETMTMTTKEDGGVVIETSPKEEFIDETPIEGGDEMIVPLEDESVDEIEAAADANSVEDGEETIDFDEIAEEEPSEEFGDLEDFEDFDEESFNGLGESYLRSCYENVSSFKTTGASVDGKKLIIEGMIKFDSGNIKETEFVFESLGKGKFEGYNKQISRGKKTYRLNTSVKNNKLVCEALNYNYRSRNELNESVRVYGTVKRKK